MDESAERDDVRRFQRVSRWVLAALVLISLALGYWGYQWYQNKPWAWNWDVLYQSAQLFGFEFTPAPNGPVPWPLHVARLLAPIATVFAVVAAASAVFGEQLHSLYVRWFRWTFAIVVGTTAEARAVARAKRKTMRVHEIDEGDVASLRRAGIKRAKVVYACGADRADVAANVATALAAVAQSGRPRINVQVSDPTLALGLKARRLMMPAGKGQVVEFFSIDEMAAQAYVAGDPIEASARPEILIAGAGAFGRAILVAFAHAWRKAGYGEGTLSVILVDPHADQAAAELIERWPVVATYCRIRVEKGDLDGLLRRENLATPYRSYICYEDEHRALSAALTAVTLWRGGPHSLVVRMSRLARHGEAFEENRLLDGLGGRLRVANVAELASAQVVTDPDPVRDLAKAIHELYVDGERKKGVAMGSSRSMVDWKDLSEDLKLANEGQAAGIADKLQRIGATIAPRSSLAGPFRVADAEVQMLGPLEHDRWVAERTSHGWKYAQKRDDARQRHPLLVPWERLSEADREKDRNAVRALETVVDPLLADVGLQIVRLKD